MLVNGYTAVTNNNTEDKNVSMGVPDKYYHNTKRLNLEYSIRKILIEFIFDNTKEFLKFVKINNSKMPKGTENLDHPRSCDWTVHFRIYYRSIIRVDLELVDWQVLSQLIYFFYANKEVLKSLTGVEFPNSHRWAKEKSRLPLWLFQEYVMLWWKIL